LRIVLSTCSPEASSKLARQLVEMQLAACVNVIPGIRSIYRWEGEIQDEAESLLVIKTSEETLAKLMQQLPTLHPYEVPEVLALEVGQGFAPYVDWVREQTRPAGA
jgi:periplasmic divalent cation tolerance protein